MQVNSRIATHPRARSRRIFLWLPVLASVLGYAALALLVLTSEANARVRGRAAITVRFVEMQGVVQAGSVAAYTAHCPAAAPRAVGPEFGGLTAAANGQLALAGSYPTGRQTWTVLIKNLSAQVQEYYAGVTCLGVPGARYALVRTSSVVDAQTDGGAILACPKSTAFPLNSTFQMQPGSAPGSAAANATFSFIDKKGRPNGRQFAGMRNLTGSPVAIFVGALCTNTRVSSGGGQSTVPAGADDGFYSSCPRSGQLAIGGELFAANANDSAAIVLDYFGARARGQWIIGARNLTTGPITYDGGPVCVG